MSDQTKIEQTDVVVPAETTGSAEPTNPTAPPPEVQEAAAQTGTVATEPDGSRDGAGQLKTDVVTAGNDGNGETDVEFRLIRWIGEAPKFKYQRLPNGTVGQDIDWDFEPTREAQYPNSSVRSMRPASIPGMTRTYHWGPVGLRTPWLAEMIPADAELLLASPSGFKFKDVTGEEKWDKYPRRRLGDPLDQGTVDELASMGLS